MILMNMHFADAFSPFSGDAILGTQRYVSMRFAIKYFSFSGEAILGTQRYVSMRFSQTSLDEGFQRKSYEQAMLQARPGQPKSGKSRFQKEG